MSLQHLNFPASLRFKAVIFDLDGVVTNSAELHKKCWKTLFNSFLSEREEATEPFEDEDYYNYVDGKPRLDGIVSFLDSRNIRLPHGGPQEPQGTTTVYSLGELKNKLLHDELDAGSEDGVSVYDSTLKFILELKQAQVKIGIASSSKNCRDILKMAGIQHLFEARCDGIESERLGLKGKPEPDIFITCADLLGAKPSETIVVEDSIAGIQAAVKGQFGLALGIDRKNNRQKMLAEGAQLVVSDLSDIHVWHANDFFKYQESSWTLNYDAFVPEQEKLREALTTLGNGIYAIRGAEVGSSADALHYPATYIAGGWNRAQTILEGVAVENEDLVNFPNAMLLKFRTEGSSDWFSLTKWKILGYNHRLNIKEGVVTRWIRTEDPDGRIFTVLSEHLVHMKKPHYTFVKLSIIPENWSGNIEVVSKIDGGVTNQGVARYGELCSKHLVIEEMGTVTDKPSDGVWLLTRTAQSRMEVAIAATCRVFSKNKMLSIQPNICKEVNAISQIFCLEVKEGKIIEIEKKITIFTSRDRGISECSLDAKSAVVKLASKRFTNMLSLHQIAWDCVWNRMDIQVALHGSSLEDSNQEEKLNLALRFHAFHLCELGSLHILGRDVSIGARGLSGEAYRGHIFWDEIFLIPFFNLRFPEISRALLLYRVLRLDAARDRARQFGYFGACYPWQSGSNGREETQKVHLNPISRKWGPDNSWLQFHVNIAIVYNAWSYFRVTGDEFGMEAYGAEMIMEIARFWGNFAKFNLQTHRYEIHGVMGPDEFHEKYPWKTEAGLNNNAYTNVMVVWLLQKTIFMYEHVLKAKKREELCQSLHITNQEIDKWKEITRKMLVCIDSEGIIEQFEDFHKLKELDWDAYKSKYGNIKRLDRILKAEGDSPDNYKVSKQADVCMIFYLLSERDFIELMADLGYEITPAQIRKNVEYYTARCSHGSTLSEIVYSGVWSQYDIGRSWKNYCSFVQSDLEDTQHGTTQEGIHVAAMAASINILLCQYAGIGLSNGHLQLDPILPKQIRSLTFNVQVKRQWLRITVTQHHTQVMLYPDYTEPITLYFHRQQYIVNPGVHTIMYPPSQVISTN